MDLQRIDLNLLKVFAILYEEQSTTRAAERLFLSQPAVSNALRRLREELQDPLFVRSPQGMLPTPVSLRLIEPVRDALQLLNQGLSSISQFDPAQARTRFRLSLNDLSASLLLPKLMSDIRQQAPGVQLASYYVKRRELSTAFGRHELDLAIDTPVSKSPQLNSLPLPALNYVVACGNQHPLANTAMSLEQYLSADHIQVSRRRRGHELVDATLADQGHRRRVVLRMEHFIPAADIARSTDCLLTIPLGLAQQLQLNYHPLPFKLPGLELRLYWHTANDLDPANQWLRQMLLQSYEGASWLDQPAPSH